MPMKKTINVFANIVGPTGYAVHARNFFKALNRKIHVCLIPKYGPLPEDDDLLSMMDRIEDIDLQTVSINLDRPQEMYRFSGSHRIAYTVFETTLLGKASINQLKQLDQVWVPSHWGQKTLQAQGVKAVSVVPEGVHPHIFSPEAIPFPELAGLNSFLFLSVGKWENRKGFRELLYAFDNEFSQDEPVRLVLYLQNKIQGLESLNVREEIRKLQLKNIGKIVVIEGGIHLDNDMARLYRSCQAYVSASKAEGWGLPIMEAMSCGLPVIAPFYSGPTEYLTPCNSYPLEIEHYEDVYCPAFFRKSGEYGQWAKIDTVRLGKSLRHVFENESEGFQKGSQAREDIMSRWTWDHAAQKALDLLGMR
ncbi:MAG: glycosyltransferase family 4 protein [Deltaproteobacteria bacterium]|nr:MAG: glycosyltransferase family 4 protein [Deltaproteobacteria bacterium]